MEQLMAHFAKLDENNVVLEVIVVSNDDIQNLPFPESEAVGIDYLNSFLPAATWKQTSYNNNFRFRYAAVGGKFHPELEEYGVFVDPKDGDNFVWDAENYRWVPPLPYPDDGLIYYWNGFDNKWSPVPNQIPPNSVTIG